MFSYFYYIDAPKKHAGARHYIAKSWRHTSSWKVLSGLILVLIGYLAITLPLGMVGENFQLKKQELEQYYVYVNSSEQDQQILASSTEPNYYESLALDYGYLDNESMISRYNRDNFFEIVFQILYFMLWYGVLEMLVASYYTHVISHVKAPASKKKKEV
ncbi:MAG: hypothetical protein H6767_03415 [Candidatus Peribacteria bacterium]|nr:MAG: hypothetical protein H6767_03415 [Candidatus Peribacteria bacterium]